ncbi:MAG TPA: hypothetical protein VGD40_10075 [Chryseosolibacter sp.]
MQPPDTPEGTNRPDQAFDALIQELIQKRKLQQEALGKIKASVERDPMKGTKAGSRTKKNSP